MPKLRVITKTPPEPQGEPEQQVAQLRDYLLQLSEELAYVLTHLEADNINDSTFQRIQEMIPKAYTGLPPMDGAASSGGTNAWSRGDHRHPHDDTKADADDLTAHVGDTANPHSVTKAQVGLGNVDNVQQYSASNPPPVPTPSEVGAIPTTEKGSAGGVAELDSGGKVPAAQLPSYVDDVLEYASQSAFPVSGESGKIYVALDTNLTYRWSGSAYVEISPSLALGETSSTAYRGDRGKTAYDHSQVVSGNPHHVTAAEVGARPDTWTPSASDVGAQPKITASGILKGDGNGGVSAATAGTDYQTPLAAGTDYQTPLVAGTDYQTPLVAGTDYATPAMIPTVPDPSDATPQDLGTADAGVSGDYSRADHVHNMPDADDIGYDNTVSGLSATDVQAALDELAGGGGGGGPSPATAAPEMDGSGAVGTSLLYAREDHEHPSDTAKADETTIAPVEASTTATSAHPLGSIFYLENVLYRALADIAIGGTINTGSGGNATQTTIAANFSRIVKLTSAQYSQLSAAEKAADIVYIVTDKPVDYVTPDMIAYVESGTTASRNYTTGQYICWNGLTYTADKNIATGTTLSASGGNKNLTECVGGGFNSLKSQNIVSTTSGKEATAVIESANRVGVLQIQYDGTPSEGHPNIYFEIWSTTGQLRVFADTGNGYSLVRTI